MSALIGKSGEAFVAAELLKRGVSVAYPAYDGGIDLIAYREPRATSKVRYFDRVVPVQVKARSSACYNFQKSWFRIENIVLVQVWYIAATPQFYIFSNLEQVENALGPVHTASDSWIVKGGYSVTAAYLGPDAIARMQPHRDQWQRITDQLENVD